MGDPAETSLVRLFEHQTRRGGKWLHGAWQNKETQEATSAPEDTAPPQGYVWVGNWKLEKQETTADKDGFEYASRDAKWHVAGRAPRAQARWNDSVRRRLWCRTMRKEYSAAGMTGQVADLSRILPRLQHGLQNIHKARKTIEQIMRQAGPQAAQSELMLSNVLSVRRTIVELSSILDQLEKQQGPGSVHVATVKKLKREVLKEDMAIDKALQPVLPAQVRGLPPTNGSSSSLIHSQSQRASEGSVTSGRGAFQPSFSSAFGDNEYDDSMKEGGYVSQTTHDQIILKKLHAVDEAQVMKDIVDERNEEIHKMHKGIVEVNEMFADLAKLVEEQAEDVASIYKNSEQGLAKTREALALIVKAEQHQAAGNCTCS